MGVGVGAVGVGAVDVGMGAVGVGMGAGPEYTMGLFMPWIKYDAPQMVMMVGSLSMRMDWVCGSRGCGLYACPSERLQPVCLLFFHLRREMYMG